jgi:hypothetical protein
VNRLWFGQRRLTGTDSDGIVHAFRNLWVPLWLIAAASAVLPATWVRRRLIPARRANAGLCPSCGYDLRASPERCPECGTPAPRRVPGKQTSRIRSRDQAYRKPIKKNSSRAMM